MKNPFSKENKEKESDREREGAENLAETDQEALVREHDENTSESESRETGTTKEGWKKKHDEMSDKYLRLYSEFDNYRKRTSRERIELAGTASAEIIISLLPVIDDFERALKSEGEKPENEGFRLIYQKLLNILTKKGLEPMESVGKDFDPELHDAITHTPAPSENQKGKIIDEIEKGYYLHGKVIRHAKVIVGN